MIQAILKINKLFNNNLINNILPIILNKKLIIHIINYHINNYKINFKIATNNKKLLINQCKHHSN